MRRLVILSMLIVGLVAACPAAVQASGPPSGRIAFVRDGDIWTMDTDGGGAQQLTGSSAVDSQPAWSPHGRKIAFLRGPLDSYHGSPMKQVWVMNGDGSHQHRVTFHLGLRQMPGTAHKKVTYSLAALAWAPNGSNLAVAAHAFSGYPSMAEGLNEAQLFLVHPNGTSQRRIGSLIYGWPERLSWRPTGAKMLLTQYYRMGYSSVKTFNLTTRRYSSTFGRAAVSKATWSADGRRIAAERSDDQVYVSGPARLVVYDARTHKRTDVLLVDRGYDWPYLSASWSPDGEWLACAVGEHQGTWPDYADPVRDIEMVPVAGGAPYQVMANADEPAWRPN